MGLFRGYTRICGVTFSEDIGVIWRYIGFRDLGSGLQKNYGYLSRVPRIRIRVFWGRLGSPCFRKLPFTWTPSTPRRDLYSLRV